jgi:hypothetical protein
MTKKRGRQRVQSLSMRNSFTDLAAQISRIPKRGSLTDISVFNEDWDDGIICLKVLNQINLDSSDLDNSSYDDMSEEDFDEEELMSRTRTPHISESMS